MGGKRFSPKTERAHRLEVLGTADLAGGMPVEREQRVLPAHADPIVGHSDASLAAALDVDIDARRPGVQGVLDQLFYDGGGPFHHFAGGDLVRNQIRQDLDRARHIQDRSA